MKTDSIGLPTILNILVLAPPRCHHSQSLFLLKDMVISRIGTVDDKILSIASRTLNYGNYGIFLIMGNAGFIPSAVSQPTSASALTSKEDASLLSEKDLLPCSATSVHAPTCSNNLQQRQTACRLSKCILRQSGITVLSHRIRNGPSD